MFDCIIFAKDPTKVQEIIKSLESNFKLTDEGDLSAYLGSDFTKNNEADKEHSQDRLRTQNLVVWP